MAVGDGPVEGQYVASIQSAGHAAQLGRVEADVGAQRRGTGAELVDVGHIGVEGRRAGHDSGIVVAFPALATEGARAAARGRRARVVPVPPTGAAFGARSAAAAATGWARISALGTTHGRGGRGGCCCRSGVHHQELVEVGVEDQLRGASDRGAESARACAAQNRLEDELGIDRAVAHIARAARDRQTVGVPGAVGWIRTGDPHPGRVGAQRPAELREGVGAGPLVGIVQIEGCLAGAGYRVHDEVEVGAERPGVALHVVVADAVAVQVLGQTVTVVQRPVEWPAGGCGVGVVVQPMLGDHVELVLVEGGETEVHVVD